MKHTNIRIFTQKSAPENFPGRVRAGTEGGEPPTEWPRHEGDPIRRPSSPCSELSAELDKDGGDSGTETQDT